MSITLDTIELSNDLVWVDQYTWSPVVQTNTHALNGALIVEVGQKLKGRKISLVGGQDFGWSDRSVIDELLVKASQPGLTMVLNYKGGTFNVMFDHSAGAVNVEQAVGYSDPDPEDAIKVSSLNFIEV